MPVFTYAAIEPSGSRTTGKVSARNRAAALDEVAQKGLVPVSVDEDRAGEPVARAARSTGGRVPQNAVETFSRELANLLAAGVPITRSLSILRRESSNPAARAQWSAIFDDVSGGMPLADAMARWPKSFPAVYVAMVHAGETGGFLDVVLMQIAEFRARERDLKGKFRNAMAYPMVLAVLAIGVLIFLMTFFIPRFSGIFASVGGNMPGLTRAIVAISKFMTDYGPGILVVLAVLVLVLRRVLKSPAGQLAAQQATLRLPVIGKLAARFALVRFCRMLGTLLGAGVPLVASLRVAREAVGNRILADAVGQSIEQVQKGKGLARSLAGNSRLFPGSVIEMIAVAEESGRLDTELKRLATVNEEELDRQLRTAVALAEPILLFVMAAIVGTIVVGMLLPVFTLQEYIR
jgi:type II secretory pathway component PulF